MDTIDKGSTVLIEVEYKRRTPFSTTLTLFDPTTPKVSVYDPRGDAVLSGQDLSKQATGQYYYILQTQATWLSGEYFAKATGADGSYIDVDVTEQVFALE